MQIANNKVVTFDYVLTNQQGEIWDQSTPDNPMTYLHGSEAILPYLERALEGARVGDNMNVTLCPEQGYGEYKAELLYEVPKDSFETERELEVGTQFQVETDDGAFMVFVKEVKEESVVVDANHPLAGQTLNFKVAIKEIREATEADMHADWYAHSHDHDHEGGCCGHDHGHDHDEAEAGCGAGESCCGGSSCSTEPKKEKSGGCCGGGCC